MEQKRSSILDLAGLLTNEGAEELKKSIAELRRRMDKEVNKRSKRIAKVLDNSRISK